MENSTYDSPTRFGYDLLKDHVLPSILGKHEDEILYWAGKEVARKFPLFNTDEIQSFFVEAGWGNLSLELTKIDEAFFTMKIADGSSSQIRTCQLESGFIAQQYQKLNGFLTECYGEVSLPNQEYKFHVKWDTKTKIEEQKEMQI